MGSILASLLIAASAGADMGLQSPAEHVVVTGTARLNGTEGPFTLALDEAGQFCFRAEASLPEGAGHTRTDNWLMGPSGVPRTVHDHERDAMLLRWWSWAGLELLDPTGSPGTSTPGDDRVRDVRVGDVVGRQTLDPSGRPVTLETEGVAGTALSIRYEGSVAIGQLMLPERTITAEAGIETKQMRVENVRLSAGSLVCPRPIREPATFDLSTAPDVEVRRAPTGHLLVRPRLAGEDVGWFILDSGAGTDVLSPAAIRRLGLDPIGTGVLITSGGTVQASWYRPADMTLGPLTLENAAFMEMDLDFLTGPLETPIAGVIGYSLLARAVVEATPADGTLRLFSPDASPFEDARWSSLKLVDQVPVTTARFSHGSGDFRLDLGAGGNAGGVVFHSPAVRRLGLDTLIAHDPTAGTTPAVPVTLPWIELAGRRFHDISTLLWTGDQGALADPNLTGNIGLDILREFSLVLDYPRERYALVAREES
jgi:predicted aspartyl protease